MGTNYITSSNNAYKIYSALLTQTGTADPVPTVLENTIGNIQWSRDLINAGEYYAVLTGAFTLDKTFYLSQVTTHNSPQTVEIIMNRVDDDTISLKTLLSGSGFTDDFLSNTPIEIKVYN
jgi:hypothetical protein